MGVWLCCCLGLAFCGFGFSGGGFGFVGLRVVWVCRWFGFGLLLGLLGLLGVADCWIFGVLTLLLSGDGFGSCVGFGVKWGVLRVCVLAWLHCGWGMLDCDLILVVVGVYC